jgi:hypothetical protein
MAADASPMPPPRRSASRSSRTRRCVSLLVSRGFVKVFAGRHYLYGDSHNKNLHYNLR